jgi:predicted transcriptional regulator
MTLLSRDEVKAIRERADANESTAEDVRRLLADLAATPPLIVIAKEGASEREMKSMANDLASKHHGAVQVIQHGWIEATEAHRATLSKWEASAEAGNVAELVIEIKAILLDNRLSHSSSVYEIGELCERLERKEAT